MLRGGSNKYPHMFWSKNKKNRYSPAYPFLLNIKVGLNGGIHYTDMFSCCYGIFVKIGGLICDILAMMQENRYLRFPTRSDTNRLWTYAPAKK